jgi:hypothetical protein
MCVKKEVFFSLSCEEEEEEFYVMYCLYKYWSPGLQHCFLL